MCVSASAPDSISTPASAERERSRQNATESSTSAGHSSCVARLGGSATNDHSRTPTRPAVTAIAAPASASGRSWSRLNTTAPASSVATRPSTMIAPRYACVGEAPVSHAVSATTACGSGK